MIVPNKIRIYIEFSTELYLIIISYNKYIKYIIIIKYIWYWISSNKSDMLSNKCGGVNGMKTRHLYNFVERWKQEYKQVKRLEQFSSNQYNGSIKILDKTNHAEGLNIVFNNISVLQPNTTPHFK